MADVRDEHERDTAQRDLRARANRLVLVAFGALICAPVGLYVIYAALREVLRARSVGVPSHPALRTAVLLATTPLVCISIVAGSMAWWMWREAHRPAIVIVANGLDVAIELRNDGRRVSEIASGERHTLELPEGPIQLCASRAPSGELVGCIAEEVRYGDAWLWNPGEVGRFVEVTTYYARRPEDERPERTEVLPRAEWIDVSGYDAVLADPPRALPPRETRRERVWLGWTYSEPVLVVIDNPYEVALAVGIDDAPPDEVPPRTATPYYLREGEHHVVVRDGDDVLFDRPMMLHDHGSYLIDPSGRVPYQRCNAEYPQNGGITYRSQPIEPALVHEPTAIDSVLDAPTAGSYWRELEHWIEWGDVPCGAVEEGPDALPNP